VLADVFVYLKDLALKYFKHIDDIVQKALQAAVHLPNVDVN
jgi:hypothetical protein